MIKLVIVDFDDTLSLTEESCFNFENYVAEKMGFPPMTREFHQKNWGKPLRGAIVERIPGIDSDKFMELVKELLPDFVDRNAIDNISPANRDTLKIIKESGRSLAILTSRSRNEIAHLMDEKYHLHKLIERFYHYDNVDFPKPDPRVFDEVLKYFDVVPDEALYIGDTVNDGVCAKGAGLHFIALLESGLRKREDFHSIQVDFFANTFPDIVNYIDTAE